MRALKTLEETILPSPYAIYVRIVVLATAALVFIGATITTTGSGLSVPDWPLSFGTINPKMVGGVYYEHGHRLVASGVGFLVLVSAIWASYIRASKVVRRLALFALGLVVFQGLLGGLTVLMRLPTAVSVAHGTVAQIFFCTVVALAWFTNPNFVKCPPSIRGAVGRDLRIASFGMTGLILLQLLVAATMRHMGAGLVIPDFPTSLGRWIPPLTSTAIAVNFTHRLLAVAILVMSVLLLVRIVKNNGGQKTLVGLGATLVGLVLVQGTLGALTVWSGRALVTTSLHVTNGALVLATSFSIALWVYRLTRPDSVASTSERRSEEGMAMKASEVSREDWKDLSKASLVKMSVFTGVCGFLLGKGDFHWSGLIVVTIGVALLGAGSSMLNHVMEVETDAQMERTKNRPLPAGRVDPALVERTGGVLVVAGTLLLGFWQPWAGMLSFLAFFSYVFVYTPMKTWSTSCTVIGAIPGGLPILVGYVVRTGQLDIQGAIIFMILFLWQLPHFMAIAWLCREDYAKAGLPMVTVIDPAGDLASSQILIYCLALIPVSLAPTLAGMTGPVYFYCALALGLMYLYAGARLCWQRTALRARKLLLTSVVYLPVLYAAMVVGF